MIGEFFAQRGNLLSRDGAGVVAPFAALISEHVGDLLIGQRLVPRLHDRTAEFLPFDGDRPLQTLEHDHGGTARTAGRKFRAGQRRILTGDAETVGLMTSLTIGRENLLAAIARRKFRLLFATAGTSGTFFRRWRTAHRIQTIAAEVSRVTSEIGAAKEHGQSVDYDQPNRERLETDARFALFSLNSSMHFLHFLVLAVIHSLTNAHGRIWSLLVHFGGGGGTAAGEPAAAGAGEAAAAGGAADFTSFKGCD